MASLMTRSVFLLFCWAMVGVCSAHDSLVARFILDYEGTFDNTKSNPGGNQPLVEVRIEIVLIPALKGIAIYLEQAINGVVALAIVCEVSKLPNRNAVRLTPYDVKEAAGGRFGEFNTARLAGFRSSVLEPYSGCPSDYVLVSNVFVGTWLQCKNNTEGKQNKFLVLVDGKSFEFKTTEDQLSLSKDTLYHLDRQTQVNLP